MTAPLQFWNYMTIISKPLPRVIYNIYLLVVKKFKNTRYYSVPQFTRNI